MFLFPLRSMFRTNEMMFRRVCVALATAALLVMAGASSADLYAKGGFGGGRSFSGGSRSFSGGSRSYSSGTKSYGSTPKAASTPKSYSSGGKTYSSGAKASAGSTAVASGLGAGVTHAQAKAQSAKAYQAKIAASKPKAEFVSTSGKSIKIDTPAEKAAQASVRKTVTHERYVTYDQRSSQAFGGYQQSSFSDHFSPFLMGYLLSSSMNSHDRAQWVHNHEDEISKERLEELKAKDAKLEEELAKLKAENAPKDPTAPPKGLDADLQYDKSFVTASLGVDKNYKPPAPVVAAAQPEAEGWGWGAWLAVLLGVGVLCVIGFMIFSGPSRRSHY